MTKKHRPQLSRSVSDQDIFDLIDTTNRQYLEWLPQILPSIDAAAISSDLNIDRPHHPLGLVFYTSSQRTMNALLG